MLGSETSTTFAPAALQPIRAAPPQRLDLGVHALEAIFARDADRQPLHRSADRRFVVGHGRVGAGRILRVGARHRAQHDRAVAHGARERSGLIERRGEGDHALARAAPVGRLDPGGAGERGGLADRAAGVARRRGQAQARRDRRGRAARRAARRQQAALVAGERRARLLDAPVRRQPRRSRRGRNRRSRSTSPWRTRPCSACRASPRRRATDAR